MKRLRNHRPRGRLGVRVEHLKGWLAAGQKKENEEAAAGEEETEGNRGGVGTYGGVQLR